MCKLVAGGGRLLLVGVLLAGFAGLPLVAAAKPNWPLPPAQLERILASEDFEILEVSGEVGGVMGVKKLTLRFPKSGKTLNVKWKAAPQGDADGWNNNPRKEIAAYQLQKWFLDPEDYVVPTIAPRGIALTQYQEIDPKAKANIRGTRCVMGAFVVWINEVGVAHPVFDETRWNEPRYRYHMANFNLLTHLIEHEDGREGNFLASDDEKDRRVFSIDNGISFSARVKNFMVDNWHLIRVPALRSETIERLRKAAPAGPGALGVVAELRADSNGVLRPVAVSENSEPKKGARVESGWIQFGLEADEIEALEARVTKLLEAVDSGKQPVF